MIKYFVFNGLIKRKKDIFIIHVSIPSIFITMSHLFRCIIVHILDKPSCTRETEHIFFHRFPTH